MATLSEMIAQLQADGYTGNWFATEDELLRCSECDADHDPAMVVIDHILRFEGQSDPDDEVILFALSDAGGRRGLYSAQFGASMPPEDVAVIGRLRRRTGDGAIAGYPRPV